MPATPLRRSVILGAAAAVILPLVPRHRARAAEEALDLDWRDLRPEDEGLAIETLRSLGVVQHGEMQSTFDQPEASAVVTRYNGKRVRIPGYAVPLDYDGTRIASLILVPYIGACIHVPPPPANQLVFVEPVEPFEPEGLWEPVYATGTLSTSAIDAGIAEIGYAMSDAVIAPYEAP